MDIRFRCNTYAHVCCDTCTFLLQHIYTCALRLMYTYLFDVHMRRNKHFYVCCNEHVYVCCNEHVSGAHARCDLYTYVCYRCLFDAHMCRNKQFHVCCNEHVSVCCNKLSYVCCNEHVYVCCNKHVHVSHVLCDLYTHVCCTCALQMCRHLCNKQRRICTRLLHTCRYVHVSKRTCICVATDMCICCNRHLYVSQQTVYSLQRATTTQQRAHVEHDSFMCETLHV